ncbi:hypothetical protein Pmani_021410 [Petrolisthes manimaculis]|uniref:Uncharacterized protein n=1 Tax=Petrolisthes manimaculis TaxID=1843537 RepID=A0AAE1PGQ7_9EUCA|nr:hypothetical protein Pmani_021410 [Petrolisthes manimaculis]
MRRGVSVVSSESLAKETAVVVEEEVVLEKSSLHHHQQHQIRTFNRPSSCNSSTPLTTKDNSHSSNGSLNSWPENESVRPDRYTRPTHLPLHGTITRTPSVSSACSTPSTPRSRSGSWDVVRAGFTGLMRAVTPSPKTPQVPYGFPSNDGCDSEVCEEEDEPEVECVRGLTGHLHHPAHECYGAVTINILGWQARWLRVGVLGLTGLPWVGGSGGLMVEVSLEPGGGRSRWLALPNAHGPKVNVKMETIVKSPREAKIKKRSLVKVSVWVCGRMWRHAAIGTALTPIPDTHTPSTSSLPVTLPLRHHTQLSDDLGLVELSLRCDYTYASEASVGSSRGEITITLEVLRAKHLRPHHPRVLARATPARLRDQVVVVCRVGLWVKGERTARESSTPVRLPVTHDPVIRTRSVFTVQREAVQHATLIVKVLYHSKWAGEDVVGRVQLGPLLYLGTCPDPSQESTPTPTPPDYNTSITLSHWGLALKTPGPTTMWHRLQL